MYGIAVFRQKGCKQGQRDGEDHVFFYEEIDAIIDIRAASSPAILLESSHGTSPETLDLSFCKCSEMLMLEHGLYLRIRSLR